MGDSIVAVIRALMLLLRRREEADMYDGERKSYIFDLDVHEGATDDEDEGEKYSVDGYAHGEHLRFTFVSG